MNDVKTDLMNVKQTCAYLSIKESHLRSLVFNKKIPTTRIGRLLRFKVQHLDKWLEQQEQK